MTQPRTADLDAVLPRLVTAVHASFAAFVVLALSRTPLDLELTLTGQLAVLALMISAGVAVAGYRSRRSRCRRRSRR